ncbi:thioredoxin domain-containing protein [Candidatus Poribacteria bacterium]|nr:thioredoxin domain-containing protein [Candidatus Poribacteria bacterium]MBT5711740.1 thioredoxin domain-containing protein [Candidatus Poribacteria bacterium]MBT7101513.1 thioredoxin domain-containing protein [Candidatus Poribacteria bacterium]MBT7809328.1 thioredoxin domain-containing protein [Candidatus Poribacteria bacterium]
MTEARANRLIHETSPYLLQHAHNPVDWYPWGDEATSTAKRDDRPILLSVGYSACHWCHVMEHESFADDDIAQVMNDHFVCVKVDREERPDIDSLYMMAVQLMTGQGGWPMTVFLTPDLEPFYAGTYFPPTDRFGRPGFGRLVKTMADYYHSSKDDLTTRTAQATEALRKAAEATSDSAELGEATLKQAYNQLAGQYDRRYGGFGTAPKFPQPSMLDYLLRYHARTGDETALRMATTTVRQMAMGGLYDHVGGGFHRYSTDERWLVPHFEKMLYDNGLIPPILLASYALTGDEFHANAARGTLDYLLRDMQAPDGGIYSTEDADSEGVEGKYYVWSAEEIRRILGEEDATVFSAHFGVQEHGNWEGANILHLTREPSETAAAVDVPEDTVTTVVERGLAALYAERQGRIRPALDDKVLTGWDGLAISALAQGGATLDDARYTDAASRAADFVLTSMDTEGRLLRAYRHAEAKIEGFLEDYAYFIRGLLDLRQASQEGRWATEAARLARVMISLFWDEDDGAFYTTGDRHERLIARLKDSHDGATPSANAVAVAVLHRLSALTGDADFADHAERTLAAFSGQIAAHPSAFTEMLVGVEWAIAPPRQIVIVGDAADETLCRGVRAVHERYLPGVTLVVHDPSAPDEAVAGSPLLAGKVAADGRTTFYVCENFVCASPTTDIDEFTAMLDS